MFLVSGQRFFRAVRYGFLGVGQNLPPLSLAEGVNEAGFAAAALYFPGFAQYDPAPLDPHIPAVSSIGVAAFLLAMCASAREAAALLSSIRIVGTADAVTGAVSPLHWILADKNGTCLVAEKTADSLEIMENPAGVLSNSPCLSWHLLNLRNYRRLTPEQTEEDDWPALFLPPFGQGGGSFGLPGDFTPPSRFVRAAWLKAHTRIPTVETQAAAAGFHILGGVSIPKGCVVTSRGTDDYTQYISCLSLRSGSCFYSTYTDRRIRRTAMPAHAPFGKAFAELARLEI